MRRTTFRRWWVAAGPLYQVATNPVFGLTPKQIDEWHARLAELQARKRIYLEDKTA